MTTVDPSSVSARRRPTALAAVVVCLLVATALVAGPAMAVQAAADAPTGIDIGSNVTTTYIGKTVMLRGDIVPGQEPGSGQASPLNGKIVVVYVMKPGKTYWSYSSNRGIYDYGNISAGWLYPYYFKPGMAKGYYKFKAVIPKYPGYLSSESHVHAIRVK